MGKAYSIIYALCGTTPSLGLNSEALTRLKKSFHEALLFLKGLLHKNPFQTINNLYAQKVPN